MLARTETEWGPWTIVEATNRYWSRMKVLETVSRRMEEALVQKGKPLPSVNEKETVGEVAVEE